MTEEEIPVIDPELEKIKAKNEERYKRAQEKAAQAALAAQAAADEADRLAQLEAEEIQKFNDEKAAKMSALAEERKIKKEELKALDESMKYEAKVAPIRIVRKDWVRKFANLNAKETKNYIETHLDDDFTDYLETHPIKGLKRRPPVILNKNSPNYKKNVKE